MQEIALPKNVNFKKGETNNEGVITIEPCYPGYGTTIGNSLRRVLLSSLPGAAVVGVKIEGVEHEFMNLPHVKEDILNIILNLKELRLKIYTDEEVKLELNVAGEKEVKAEDIKKNSDVEIVNPDLVLANITDMAGSLKMEIYAARGRGYRTIEGIEDKKKEIGYIDMDSIFSPVVSVGLNVEDMRVGKMTNWEKLTLDIATDGTITPQEAFEQSVNIMISQYGALVDRDLEEIKEEVKTKREEDAKKEKEAEEDSEESEEEKSEKEQGESSSSSEADGEKKKRGRPKKSE